MSGFEIAGITLGVLPLLIKVAENWHDIFRPFRRFRRFLPELIEFEQVLNTQKTIFQNECRLLLEVLAGRVAATKMLKQPDHPYWLDPHLDEKFAQQLGESGKACEDIVESIRLKLVALQDKATSFSSVIQTVPVSTSCFQQRSMIVLKRID